ncbi:MAG: NB-ARC domain-containing protein [Trichodesmium sp. ALOHA_ZT_67]|nr:NB-ARC domain-containing protein [Trichodesmium sp. ALOHA_ZT_67]
MDINTLVELADNLIFTKTREHLTSLQKEVLKGTLNGKKYPQIADDCKRHPDHIKQVGTKLWKLLSDILGKNIKKSNARSILEKFHFSHISNTGDDCVNINSNHINICGENKQSPTPKNKSSPTLIDQKQDNTNPENYYDLSEAPDLYPLCDRHSEVTTLKQLILQNHSRIITILGLTGIGKSTLTVELIAQIKNKFDYIIWRNIDNYSSCESLQINILKFLSQTDFTSQKKEKISNSQTINNQLIDYLRKYRCLLIFDNLQEIFASGKLAGTYLQEHENYGKFFQQIATLSHQSCLLLLSQEKPKIISTNNHCHTLKIDGLGKSAVAILKDINLTDEEQSLELINLYSGNPLWLNIIADAVEDLFNGNIAQILSCPSIYLGDLEPILDKYFQRLSELEKQVILWMASQETAVDIYNTSPDFPLLHSDLWKGIQSLKRRCLVIKQDNLFALLAVLKQYIISNYLH